MAITADQISDFRKDVGDNGSTEVFSDEEIERLFERCEEDYQKMVVLGFDQILADAAKLHDYAAGQSRETLSQVVKNLERARDRAQEKYRENQGQIRFVGSRIIPPKTRQEPRR